MSGFLTNSGFNRIKSESVVEKKEDWIKLNEKGIWHRFVFLVYANR